MGDFLKSGKVLFNDQVGIYVNKVFDKVLAADGGVTKNDVRLYIVKSNYSNAFASDQGAIFVTTGLLTRIQNEAQLAFILCHELVHFKKKHSIDVFVYSKTKDQKSTKESSVLDFFSKAAYSKEKETEADKNGLDIFLKTGYSADAAVSVFNVLHYSYLPFSSIEFDRSFVEIGPFKWLNNQFIGETTPVFAEEDEDDTSSTHPNTFKRKELIKSIISGNEGKEYLISKEEFQLIQKICRYEYCREALLNRDYTGAIYSAFALLKEDTTNLYLKKVIAKSLYSISTYYNQGYRDELRMRYHLEQGPSQRATYFFKDLYAYEANAFAAYYLFTLCSQHPDDKELKPLLDETLYWLAYLHYPTIQKTQPDKEEFIDSTPYALVLDTIQNAADSINVDAMRLLNTNNSFNAMLDLDGFMSLYKEAYKKTVTDKAAAAPLFSNGLDSTESSIELTKGERNRNFLNEYKNYIQVVNYRKHEDYIKVKKQYSGIFNNKLSKMSGEKIVFINPQHFSVDMRKKIPLMYEASEKSRDIFIERLTESAKEAKIPFEMLSDNQIDTNGVELLNTIVKLQDWAEEVFLHDNVSIIPTDQTAINKLSEQLNSRYLCFTGSSYSIIKKEPDAIIGLTLASIYVVTLPFTLPLIFNKWVETNYFLMALDLKTGEFIAPSFSSVSIKDKQDISLATFYDFLQKLKLEQLLNK